MAWKDKQDTIDHHPKKETPKTTGKMAAKEPVQRAPETSGWTQTKVSATFDELPAPKAIQLNADLGVKAFGIGKQLKITKGKHFEDIKVGAGGVYLTRFSKPTIFIPNERIDYMEW